MKKVLLYITMIFMTLSCEDYLELLPPDDLVLEEFWKSKEELESVLMGAYKNFAALDATLFYYGELRADMLWYDDLTPQNIEEIFYGNILPDNNLSNWSGFYKVINFCNAVIHRAPIIRETDVTLSDYQMNIFISEATFLRSLAYFYLLRTFRDVPLILEPVESDAVEFYLTSSSSTAILSQIKSDLISVKTKAATDFGSTELNKGRATQAAITALLADICLWNFEYEECIVYVEEIEEMDFLIMSNSAWFKNFYPGNSLESIFEFQYNSAFGEPNRMYNITRSAARRFEVSPNASQLFFSSAFENEETRGNGSISADGKVWKYVGREADGKTARAGTEQSECNYIIYRLSDVLLMKAEALSQLSRFDEALQIVNTIRIKRRVAPAEATNTKEAFENLVLKERALELAFEGKRWFDLLRMGRRNDYERKSDLIDILIENIESIRKPVMRAKLTDPAGWYLPIYDVELERNKNLEQNPYYENY